MQATHKLCFFFKLTDGPEEGVQANTSFCIFDKKWLLKEKSRIRAAPKVSTLKDLVQNMDFGDAKGGKVWNT